MQRSKRHYAVGCLVVLAACSSGHASPSPPAGVVVTKQSVQTAQAHFTIEIPKDWIVHPIPADAAPSSGEVFAAESPDGPLLNVNVRAGNPAPLTDLATATENAVRTKGAQAIARSTIRIDGEDSIRLTYSLPVGANGPLQPVFNYLVKHGSTLYVLGFGGPGKLDQKLADFIAESTHFA